VNGDPKSQRIAAQLNKDERRIPLLNRAIQGEYPAGSTFKPITAIAAMEEGMMRPDELIGCPPSMDIFHTPFPNNTDLNLGRIPLSMALEVSCNTYFYNLGLKFFNVPDRSPLQEWATKLGLGHRTGIDIPGEASGLVPTPKWRKEAFADAKDPMERKWKPGYSVNLAIGQGDLRVTPLQMTNAYATIANGGTVRTPHLAKSVQGPGGREMYTPPKAQETDLHLDESDRQALLEGMRLVNEGGNGTASAVFQGFSVPTAGKTGTAERQGHTDTGWYCGFAPADEPTIAACVVVDGGGHGGTSSAPVVLKMFQEWFGAEGGNASGGGGTD
jgi:penicillin-binding protein 2